MITLPPRQEIRPGISKLWVRLGRRMVELPIPEVVRQPFVFNCGVGTDSTAALVLLAGMFALGDDDARPDLILFADTGDEKQNTYDYVPVLQKWLAKNNFPPITLVKRNSKHASLGDGCMTLRTMPSLAYGGKSCSLKSKASPMDVYLNNWQPAAIARTCGLPVRKFIGYDGGKADCRRSANPGDDRTEYIYPLRDAKLQRADLQQIIANAGLPDPGKSACFMCPASKKPEIVYLGMTEPAKLATALRMEAKAMLRTAQTKTDFSTKGLGRTYAWREFLEEHHARLLETVRGAYDIGDAEWSSYQALVDAKCPA